MLITLWIAVVILAFDVAIILIQLVWRITFLPIAPPLSELGPLFVGAGALVALIAFLFNLGRARSDDILTASTSLFEKAYGLIYTEDGPINSRLAWLSSARLLATAQKLAGQITESSHKAVYEQQLEYWRHRFYDLIFPSAPEGLPQSFYAEEPDHLISWSGTARSPISEKSLAYLYRFVRWQEGKPDPIGNEPNFTEEELQRMELFGPRHLGSLLRKARQLAEVGRK